MECNGKVPIDIKQGNPDHLAMELEVVTEFVHPFACFATTPLGHAGVVLEEDGGVEVVGGGGVVRGGFEGEDGAELT